MQAPDGFLSTVINQVSSGNWRGALETIRVVFSADACCVRMIAAESLLLVDAVGIPEDQLWIKFSVRERLPARVLSHNKPTIVRDVYEDPLTKTRAFQALMATDKYYFRCFIGMPLRWEGRPLGILGLYRKVADATLFPSAPETLQAVSSVLALALYNIRNLSLLRSQAEEISRLSEEANFDSLTNLMNRRAFEQTAAKEIARAHRNQTPLALSLVDIDRFKQVNDKYGHEAGDHALRALASCLMAHTRKYDHVARWGGEEFLILFPGVTGDTALALSDNLRRRIEEELADAAGSSKKITCSFGVTELCSGDMDLHDMVKRADTALYHAKRTGRNLCHVHRGTYGHEATEK